MKRAKEKDLKTLPLKDRDFPLVASGWQKAPYLVRGCIALIPRKECRGRVLIFYPENRPDLAHFASDGNVLQSLRNIAVLIAHKHDSTDS